ncbi:hypothetical protein C1H46_038697 [Malus baccata]|uniref:Uncharacterized protein n=1 Tax=Malus baccata TaxID=106549 RepID=A0A540KNM5_MALBA|nr:hypothetical protein C1H46_038697 [Malus baccata]
MMKDGDAWPFDLWETIFVINGEMAMLGGDCSDQTTVIFPGPKFDRPRLFSERESGDLKPVGGVGVLGRRSEAKQKEFAK